MIDPPQGIQTRTMTGVLSMMESGQHGAHPYLLLISERKMEAWRHRGAQAFVEPGVAQGQRLARRARLISQARFSRGMC